MTDATDESAGRHESSRRQREPLTPKPPTLSLARNPNDQGDPCEQGGLKANAARIPGAHEDGAPGSCGRAALTPPARCLGGLTNFQKENRPMLKSAKRKKSHRIGAGRDSWASSPEVRLRGKPFAGLDGWPGAWPQGGLHRYRFSSGWAGLGGLTSHGKAVTGPGLKDQGSSLPM